MNEKGPLRVFILMLNRAFVNTHISTIQDGKKQQKFALSSAIVIAKTS